MTKERESLINDLLGHQSEIESMYKNNKVLKNRVKKLEAMLYGRVKTK